MTAEELHKFFNDRFQMGQWPRSLEVDAATYGNVCQFIFEHQATRMISHNEEFSEVIISLGPNRGLMFKNVELIKKESKG